MLAGDHQFANERKMNQVSNELVELTNYQSELVFFSHTLTILSTEKLYRGPTIFASTTSNA